MPRSLPLLAALILPTLPSPALAALPADYLRDIKPLLRDRCFACHGALQQKGRLRVDTAAALRKVVVPGKPAASELLGRLRGQTGERMPPEGPPLSAAQIALIEDWIQRGAPAPAGEQPEADPRTHWSFAAPKRPLVPSLAPEGGNALDAFLDATRRRQGLTGSPPADPASLLRRVHLDLTGLPPTREDLRAFLADPSPAAYGRVVERLLASPAHGERWARHWLDVWRYADWYGRRAVPDVWNSAPQVWRWRDWVVNSLNADLGYDRIVQLMLAGDELAGDDPEQVVATGYLVRSWYALNPNQWLREAVEHTGKAFLGLTFNCAHCHDHKYDPIRQDDYFRLRAVFEPLGLRQDRWPGEPDPGPFQKYSYSTLRKVQPLGRVSVFDEQPEAKTYVYAGGDERDRVKGRPAVEPGVPAFLGGAWRLQPVKLPPKAVYPGLEPFLRADELGRREQALAAARTAAGAARAAHGAALGAKPLAPALVEKSAAELKAAQAALESADLDVLCVRARFAADDVRYGAAPGDLARATEQAGRLERLLLLASARSKQARAEADLAAGRQAGAALPPLQQKLMATGAEVTAAEAALASPVTGYASLTPVYPATSTGRRLALARWITARDNPLTARVAVNHVWRWHFGRPLVESVSDFGRNGKAPSHPELLDWLAVELQESGWSLKHLHRLILTSQAYRQRSSAGDNHKALARDPNNVYLWRFAPRRLEAETVRDALLATAGQLDRSQGGRPLEHAGPESTSRRRSLYFTVHPEVGGQDLFLTLFDAPDPCDCYARSSSVLPQQALALTNSAFLANLATALARPLAALPDDGYVTALYEQVVSRGPTAAEASLCLSFLARQADAARRQGLPDPAGRARAGLARVLFNHDDFLTLR